MSYLPTTPPPPPEDQSRPQGRGRDLWYGLAVGLAGCLLVPFLAFVVPDPTGASTVALLTPLAVLVVGLVLVFIERTRRWGAGLLLGFAVSLVIGAGACVVLLASLGG
jgi:drug/metabolite transporter (DMT)-like permease